MLYRLLTKAVDRKAVCLNALASSPAAQDALCLVPVLLVLVPVM